MKKILLVIAVLLVIGGGAFLYLKKNNDDDSMLGVPTPTGSTSQNTPGTASSSSSASTYKNGTYTGTAVEADRGYGIVQVKAVISNGKLSDIVFVQMPDAPGHTSEVTAFAEPVLKQEAIAKQNAQVDIVTGATQTTEAFQKSLASALTQAQ